MSWLYYQYGRGRVDNTDGGWMRSEKHCNSMQNFTLTRSTHWFLISLSVRINTMKALKKQHSVFSHPPAFVFFTLFTLIPTCSNLFIYYLSLTLSPRNGCSRRARTWVLFRQNLNYTESAVVSDSTTLLVNIYIFVERMTSSLWAVTI